MERLQTCQGFGEGEMVGAAAAQASAGLTHAAPARHAPRERRNATSWPPGTVCGVRGQPSYEERPAGGFP